MLIDFTVGNFRSIAEPQTLTLIASKDSSHPDHVVERGDFHLLKSTAIYGKNASGKSNFLKAFMFIDRFISISATKMNLGDTIPGIAPFRLGDTYKDKPSLFEIRLIINGTVYQYGFTVTPERVHDEWLNVKSPDGKIRKSFSRTLSVDTGETHWTLHGELKEQAKGVIEKTRDNCLFLSRSAEMNVEFVAELFLWFRRHLFCFDLSDPIIPLFAQTATHIQKDEFFRKRVEKLIHAADVDIDHISAKREIRSFPEDMPPGLRNLFIELQKAEQSNNSGKDAIEGSMQHISVKTLHRIADTDKFVEFSLEDDESNGTQKYFGLIGVLLEALDDGDLLVFDEFECSLHPNLTRKLVELFHSPEANSKGSQLVFATHDTNLMTHSLFRRDQIWFTDKNQKAGTELFSLSDIEKRPRKREAFEKNYLSGSYGGVPNFGPALEGFEIR